MLASWTGHLRVDAVSERNRREKLLPTANFHGLMKKTFVDLAARLGQRYFCRTCSVLLLFLFTNIYLNLTPLFFVACCRATATIGRSIVQQRIGSAFYRHLILAEAVRHRAGVPSSHPLENCAHHGLGKQYLEIH